MVEAPLPATARRNPADIIVVEGCSVNAYTEVDLRRAAAAGIRAPSLHNSQPWRFRRSLGRFGRPQMTLRIGYGDPGRPTPRRDLDDVLLVD